MLPVPVIGGTGYTLYEFQGSNNALYTTSCGQVNDDGWKVTDGSCNFYTASTKIAPALEATQVVVRTTLSNNGTLDSRDFAWIFYYLNDKVIKTVTVRGDMSYPQTTLEDSLMVKGGDVMRIRISFICDKSDEQWLLPDGGLICFIPSESEETPVETNEVITKAEELKVESDDDGNLVTWEKSGTAAGIYYLVERSADGREYEFAGYVNSGINDGLNTVFQFREKSPGKRCYYRVTSMSQNGQKMDIVGTAVTTTSDITAQSP